MPNYCTSVHILITVLWYKTSYCSVLDNYCYGGKCAKRKKYNNVFLIFKLYVYIVEDKITIPPTPYISKQCLIIINHRVLEGVRAVDPHYLLFSPFVTFFAGSRIHLLAATVGSPPSLPCTLLKNPPKYRTKTAAA